MMSDIYQNAAINVSADSGIDSRAGCFVTRDQVDIIPLGIHCPQLSQSWQMLPVAQNFFEWMAGTSSFSRAWIHRERQLARRVLHFTDKEMIWECCGIEGRSFASEMLPGGAPFTHGLFNLDHKYQIGRLQQGLIEESEEAYATWNDVCENLSEKNLTKASDMPVVLSGLAKDFSRMLSADKYISGLWETTLPQSLLWHTMEFKRRDLEYIAPSWTWLSTGSAVKLANRQGIEDKIPVAIMLSISTKLMYEDPYGPVEKGGRLDLEGFLRRIRISFTSDLFNISVYDHEDKSEEMRTLGPSWEPYLGDFCQLNLDSKIEKRDLDCFCLFITVNQYNGMQGSSRDVACLLLKRIDEDSNQFTRIGTLLLKDLYALKMRYKPILDVKEDAWKSFQKEIKDHQDNATKAQEKRTNKRVEGTTHTASATAHNRPQGADALYHFDDINTQREGFERLTPQVLTIF